MKYFLKLMEPYEPLLVEHRLIERLFDLIRTEIKGMNQTGKANKEFIDVVTDFFVTYVDVAHHGKEENIMFEAMNKKNLTAEDKSMMNELIKEHKLGRKVVNQLIESSNDYFNGSQDELKNIIARFKDFVDIYTEHIDKEDNDYFMQVMNYFSDKERDDMIQDFWRFDIKLIHEKYSKLFDLMEGN